jgi:hypothetical protein
LASEIGPTIDAMMIPKLALTYEEAAEATGFSVSTLRWAVRRNDLIARYAKSKPVLRVSELDEWLASLPTEPRGGHAPIGRLAPDVATYEVSTPEDDTSAGSPMFRTPEQVAKELGLPRSTVRTYSRASGIYTKVGRRHMLDQNDVGKLVAWIRDHQDKEREATRRHDPFA